MKQIQYVCRITWGKFSYFLPPEWVFASNADPEALRVSVAKRWSVIKACEVQITHFKVLQVKDGVPVSTYQMGA